VTFTHASIPNKPFTKSCNQKALVANAVHNATIPQTNSDSPPVANHTDNQRAVMPDINSGNVHKKPVTHATIPQKFNISKDAHNQANKVVIIGN
jgi:hypothetical protein